MNSDSKQQVPRTIVSTDGGAWSTTDLKAWKPEPELPDLGVSDTKAKRYAIDPWWLCVLINVFLALLICL